MQTFELKFTGTPISVTKKHIKDAFIRTVNHLEPWLKQSLVPALIYGGLGIQGIAQTPFYTFVKSNEGLSQLGIRPEDPPKLLQTYFDSHVIVKRGTFLELRFGDRDKLLKGTPHWANGTGLLRIGSWMEWVLLDRIVSNFGYVPRQALPPNFARKSRLKAPLGGLMLAKDRPISGNKTASFFGSSGRWEFPKSLKDYYIPWFNQNQGIIAKVIEQRFITVLQALINR